MESLSLRLEMTHFQKSKKEKKEKKCWCGDFRCTHLRTPAGITYDKSK